MKFKPIVLMVTSLLFDQGSSQSIREKYNEEIAQSKYINRVDLSPSPSPSTHRAVEDDAFAACLLTMDDNFRLIEWLAFHYHVLPLRKLVVAVDPRSRTSPLSILERWKDYMKIELWEDHDIFSDGELQGRISMPKIESHRARQRAFNVKCMKHLREQGAGWTILTDVDEYAYVNPRVKNATDSLYDPSMEQSLISEPGSVMKMLQSMDVSLEEKSPCLPLPRLQFGGIESLPDEVEKMFPKTTLLPPSFKAADFDTFRWRHYNDQYSDKTLPAKTIIDLSRILQEDEILFIGDPHHPIKTICKTSGIWMKESESRLVVNHILGTMEQYMSRDDSRLARRIISYDSRNAVQGHISDEVRPWLDGFVNDVGQEEARRLLSSACSTVGLGNAGHEASRRLQQSYQNQTRCSLNFFGLPRSFKSMVLPSLVENVLLPNAKYSCDIVVHYYRINVKEEGRFSEGGVIEHESILSLKRISQLVAEYAGTDPPNVSLRGETKGDFHSRYDALVSQYHQMQGDLRNSDKRYASKEQIENMVMQWNSIQSAWNEMMVVSSDVGVEYERVAFFGLDVFFATPIDIYQVNKDTRDDDNHFTVIPAFGKFPVSDRMIYGPTSAIRIWATERIARLNQNYQSTDLQNQAAYGIHSESFLSREIMTAIQKSTGVAVMENVHICFYSARADNTVLLSDCDDSEGRAIRGISEIEQKQIVEELVGLFCGETSFDNHFIELRCYDKSSGWELPEMIEQRYLTESTEPPTFPPLEEILEQVEDFIEDLQDDVEAIQETVEEVQETLEEIGETVEEIGETIGDIVETVVDSVVGFVEGVSGSHVNSAGPNGNIGIRLSDQIQSRENITAFVSVLETAISKTLRTNGSNELGLKVTIRKINGEDLSNFGTRFLKQTTSVTTIVDFRVKKYTVCETTPCNIALVASRDVRHLQNTLINERSRTELTNNIKAAALEAGNVEGLVNVQILDPDTTDSIVEIVSLRRIELVRTPTKSNKSTKTKAVKKQKNKEKQSKAPKKGKKVTSELSKKKKTKVPKKVNVKKGVKNVSKAPVVTRL